MNSYEEILGSMKEKYEELSKSTVSEQSDIMLRLRVLAGEIYNNLIAQEFVKRQMFVSSATGEYIDKHALSRGLYRKEATKAVGEVTFSVSVAPVSDIIIEKGTVVSTKSEDAVSFVTDETVTIYAGNMNATVSVTAVTGGANHNVAAESVTVIVTPTSGVTSVTNTKAMKGGSDEESDDELRERVLNSYRDIPNGTNAAYYKRLALSVPGVYSASVVAGKRGAGTLNIYLVGKQSSPVGKEIIEEVQSLVDENRELNVDVEVVYATKLSVDFTLKLKVEQGYSFDEVKAQIESDIAMYIESLGVGKEVLLCDLGEVIYHVEGVKNYEFVDAFCGDVYPEPNEYCVLSQLEITEVS